MSASQPLPLRGPLGALMFGNFVVACGVMVMPGMLDRLAQDLQVSVPTAGQLLSLAALAMCLGAPLFAAFTSRVDRRLLLTASLLAVAIGHVACALAPGYPMLAPLSLASWLQVARSTRLRRILGTTLLWCTGQFIVLGYITPLLRHDVTNAATVQAALLVLMGISGLAGNVLLTRRIGRIGADRSARLALALVACGLALWCAVTLLAPSTAAMAVVIVVWGAGSFAFVSAQQARLGASAPELASASIALNSSSLYAGQALGATIGGVLLATLGDDALAPAALVTMGLALWLCTTADRPAPSPA